MPDPAAEIARLEAEIASIEEDAQDPGRFCEWNERPPAQWHFDQMIGARRRRIETLKETGS